MRGRIGREIFKKAKHEEEQIEIDEVVQGLMELEMNQRKAEGDNEGFKEGSKLRLMFNIWKTEKDWSDLTKHEERIKPTAADPNKKTTPEEECEEQESVINEGKDQGRGR